MALDQAEKDRFFKLLCEMSIMDAAEMKRRVEDELGSSFSLSIDMEAPLTAMAYACQTCDGRMGGEAPEPLYNITLANTGTQRIAVMRLVREMLELSPLEAKNFIDDVPQTIGSNLYELDADQLEKAFSELGAKTERKET